VDTGIAVVERIVAVERAAPQFVVAVAVPTEADAGNLLPLLPRP
jgi:hypothetical protein